MKIAPIFTVDKQRANWPGLARTRGSYPVTIMAVFYSWLLFALSVSCATSPEIGHNDANQLQRRLNQGLKSEPLSDSFKFSPELFNGLTFDGAKTLLEIIFNVDDYDRYRGEGPTFVKASDSISQYGVLASEHVLAMQPEVCVLFADYYEAFVYPEQTPQECISVFLDNAIKSQRIREVWLGYFPAAWVLQRPIELLDMFKSSHWPERRSSKSSLPLEDLEMCSRLTVGKVKELVYFGISPSAECFARIADLDSMELSDLQALPNTSQLFLYYNGCLSKSVTAGMSPEMLRSYASKVEGDICQNLHLEFVGDGIVGVTARCLHGYFLARIKPLDIGKIPQGAMSWWILKYPSDFRHIMPEYFGALPHSCWQNVLNHRDNLTKEILGRIALEDLQKPAVLDLHQECQELIKSNAPAGFLESIQTKFAVDSLLESLNRGSREIADKMINHPCDYPDNFFSGLETLGAQTLLSSACGTKDYPSLIGFEQYQNLAISLKFIDSIEPDQANLMKPEVCAIFLHALQNVSCPEEIPKACWRLHLEELLCNNVLNAANLPFFPTKWLSYRKPNLFVLAHSTKSSIALFDDDFIKTMLENSKDCAMMKLDYFAIYSVIIPPSCVAHLSDLGTAGDTAVKNLGPDAFSFYNGPLSAALLKRITKEQLASFGEKLDQPMICNELGLDQVSLYAMAGVTKNCLEGYFSKPTGALGQAFQVIPKDVLLGWMKQHPQGFQNVALSDRTRIPQFVWAELLFSQDRAPEWAEKLFKGQDDIGLLNLPSCDLDEEHLKSLLATVPLLAHALIVRAKTLPVNLYDILGPVITEGITVCHQKRAGIHLFATLKNVENAASVIEYIPPEFCASLRKGEYLRYTWLRVAFSEKCRQNLKFTFDYLTPELLDDPKKRLAGLSQIDAGYVPQPEQKDLERILLEFNGPECKDCIKWSKCEKDNIHYSKGRICKRGQLKVPSNYKDPEGGTFELTFYQYTQRGQIPRAHLLFLNGGPGGPGVAYRDNATLISELTNGDVATYLVDHRGLGESGQFTETKESWEIETSDLKNAIVNKKLDEKDLQLVNAALDVNIIASALSHGDPDSRLSVYGFSYGALWAHEAAQLAPNLFDSIILGGMPARNGSEEAYTLWGILEHCKLDPFCSSKMGSDIPLAFSAMVERLGKQFANRCVKEMRRQLEIPSGTPESIISSISAYLRKFVFVAPLPGATWTNVQILLPFVKATVDCTDFDGYVENVILPLKNAVQKYKQDTGPVRQIEWSLNESNSFVNQIVNFNISNDSSLKKRSELHPYYNYQLTNPFPASMFCKFCLAGQDEHSQGYLNSAKTATIHMQGLFDARTSYRGGEEFFNRVTVPSKIFQPVNNRGHNLTGPCEAKYILAAVYGQSTLAAEQCFEESNQSEPIKWEFSETEHPFKNIWSMVKDAPIALPTVTRKGAVISSMDMPTHADWIGNLVHQDFRLKETEDDESGCRMCQISFPVNYKRSVEKRFEFKVWNCGQLKDSRVSGGHVILLTDSAEYLTSKNFEYARSLTRLGFVVYLSQYRGLEEYSHLKGVPWNKAQANELKMANLSGEYVSNDVALLAMAIRNDESRWREGDKLILIGNDLGAQIGYNVAAVFPNLFDTFILSNVFGSVRDLAFDPDTVINSCAEDPTCQKLVDALSAHTAREFIKTSITSMFFETVNDCNKQLHEFLESLTPGTRTFAKISSALAILVSYDPRLLVAFAAISKKCSNLGQYTQMLHGPISEIFRKFKEASVSKNDFVDSILRIRIQYQNFTLGSRPAWPHLSCLHWGKYLDCHIDSGPTNLCESSLLQQPVTLQKGKLYMLQSDLYPNAPSTNAKMLYDRTEGDKVWIPLRHALGSDLWTFVQMVLKAEVEGKTLDLVQECKAADDKAATDWEKVWKLEL
ncbi:Proteinase (Secreted protein) [Paramicrosporidium saccamoebae]|uniref:Proteinase (Secreted protein) n=1 Tax=Paramicrosporidium saccamoebae TaxID=1246581 RepID=A0A2H9TLI2_9FUNG|nr:Proteinase (Secreted protein) [Paramicrosporidium saccamoebae]